MAKEQLDEQQVKDLLGNQALSNADAQKYARLYAASDFDTVKQGIEKSLQTVRGQKTVAEAKILEWQANSRRRPIKSRRRIADYQQRLQELESIGLDLVRDLDAMNRIHQAVQQQAQQAPQEQAPVVSKAKVKKKKRVRRRKVKHAKKAAPEAEVAQVEVRREEPQVEVAVAVEPPAQMTAELVQLHAANYHFSPEDAAKVAELYNMGDIETVTRHIEARLPEIEREQESAIQQMNEAKQRRDEIGEVGRFGRRAKLIQAAKAEADGKVSEFSEKWKDLNQEASNLKRFGGAIKDIHKTLDALIQPSVDSAAKPEEVAPAEVAPAVQQPSAQPEEVAPAAEEPAVQPEEVAPTVEGPAPLTPESVLAQFDGKLKEALDSLVEVRAPELSEYQQGKLSQLEQQREALQRQVDQLDGQRKALEEQMESHQSSMQDQKRGSKAYQKTSLQAQRASIIRSGVVREKTGVETKLDKINSQISKFTAERSLPKQDFDTSAASSAMEQMNTVLREFQQTATAAEYQAVSEQMRARAGEIMENPEYSGLTIFNMEDNRGDAFLDFTQEVFKTTDPGGPPAAPVQQAEVAPAEEPAPEADKPKLPPYAAKWQQKNQEREARAEQEGPKKDQHQVLVIGGPGGGSK